jgi:GTPase SAR1 family protein
VTSSYYRGATGIVLTFDITSKESFDDLQEWLAEVPSSGTPRLALRACLCWEGIEQCVAYVLTRVLRP